MILKKIDTSTSSSEVNSAEIEGKKDIMNTDVKASFDECDNMEIERKEETREEMKNSDVKAGLECSKEMENVEANFHVNAPIADLNDMETQDKENFDENFDLVAQTPQQVATTSSSSFSNQSLPRSLHKKTIWSTEKYRRSQRCKRIRGNLQDNQTLITNFVSVVTRIDELINEEDTISNVFRQNIESFRHTNDMEMDSSAALGSSSKFLNALFKAAS